MSVVAAPPVGRSEVNTSRARNSSRKKICEILRKSGNLDRTTNLLHRLHLLRTASFNQVN
jgi:hypothetical protein